MSLDNTNGTRKIEFIILEYFFFYLFPVSVLVVVGKPKNFMDILSNEKKKWTLSMYIYVYRHTPKKKDVLIKENRFSFVVKALSWKLAIKSKKKKKHFSSLVDG